jgi:DNA-binding transcriptional regulator YbjK
MTLLEAVLKIVAEAGADAVTHRRVAEEAGLPLASTTYWFESKEHLLTAALELAAERDVARLHAYVPKTYPLPNSIDAAVAEIVELLDEDLGTSRGSLLAAYALLLEAARRPALQALARGWTEAYLGTLGRPTRTGWLDSSARRLGAPPSRRQRAADRAVSLRQELKRPPAAAPRRIRTPSRVT